MEQITAKAPAKINWYLAVKRRRADGYHEIETVLQTIPLYDTLTRPAPFPQMQAIWFTALQSFWAFPDCTSHYTKISLHRQGSAGEALTQPVL